MKKQLPLSRSSWVLSLLMFPLLLRSDRHFTPSLFKQTARIAPVITRDKPTFRYLFFIIARYTFFISLSCKHLNKWDRGLFKKLVYLSKLKPYIPQSDESKPAMTPLDTPCNNNNRTICIVIVNRIFGVFAVCVNQRGILKFTQPY